MANQKPPTRRGVFDAKTGFLGWKTILSIIDQCHKTPYYMNPHPFLADSWREKKRRELRLRDFLLISLSFLTGGRISEVLMLRTDNFVVDGDWITVAGMPLLKRYKIVREEIDRMREIPSIDEAKNYMWVPKEGAFINYDISTIPEVEERQDFPIARWEPLTSEVTALLDKYTEQGKEWLFESDGSPQREESPGIQKWVEERFNLDSRMWISPQRSWQIVTDASYRAGVTIKLGRKKLGIWDHWLRSQRGNQLVRDYRFTDPLLDRYFGWKIRDEDTRMSRHYTSVATYDLEDQMTFNKPRFERNFKVDMRRNR